MTEDEAIKLELRNTLFTLRKLSARSPDELEDYLHNAIVRNLERGRSLLQWMGQVYQAVRQFIAFGNREVSTYEPLTENCITIQPQARLELCIAIKQAILLLTPTQQVVILAYFFEGKTLEEIAKERKTSLQNIHHILQRALSNLRRSLS